MARRVEEHYRGSKVTSNVNGFGLRLRVEFGNAFLFSAVCFTDEVAARNSSDVGKKTGLYIRPLRLVRFSDTVTLRVSLMYGLSNASLDNHDVSVM